MRRKVVIARTGDSDPLAYDPVGGIHLRDRHGPLRDVVLIEGQRIGAPTVRQPAFRKGAASDETIGHKARQIVVWGCKELPPRRVAQKLSSPGGNDGAQTGTQKIADRIGEPALEIVKGRCGFGEGGFLTADIPQLNGVPSFQQGECGVRPGYSAADHDDYHRIAEL